jgi:hypothetical protein
VLPYLTWDNAATLALLESLGEGAGSADGAGIADRAREVTGGPLDALDAGAVHARNLELRALLAEAVRGLRPAEVGGGPASEARAGVAAYVRERIARDPSAGRPRRAP